MIDPAVGYWWLLYHEDAPARAVGFCGLSKSPYSKNFGYLKRSGVALEHRGSGLQLRMIRVREAHAKKLGWSYVITDTTDNPASSNTLIRAGYKLFTPRHPWGPYATTLYWKRTINGQR
ncbi:GNAT family N-acetyltransferase [Bradyrhizobium quebecense]|nr:GNAT family N-acetyltransferase [Bradyrhizobium quebecense]UGA46816.1 GNAT family N-acetyltransferase [Bradyrhizobium quebecense]